MSRINPTHSHVRRLPIFAAVGAINTALDVVVFACLYEVAGFGVVLSNVLAFLVAASNSYAMNRFVTFADRHRRDDVAGSFVRFITIAVLALAVSTAIVYVASQFIHPFAAKLVATAASTLISYVCLDRLVFAAKKRLHENAAGSEPPG